MKSEDTWNCLFILLIDYSIPYNNFYDQKWLIKNFNWSVKYDASLFFYRFSLKSVPEFPLRSRFRNFQQQKRFKRFRILFHNGHVSRNNTVNATHFTLFRSSFTRVRHFVTQWKPAVSPVNYPTVRGLREIDALLNNFRCPADAWYIEYVMRGCEWSNDVSFLTGVVRGSVNLLCFLFFFPSFFVLWHLFVSFRQQRSFKRTISSKFTSEDEILIGSFDIRSTK